MIPEVFYRNSDDSAFGKEWRTQRFNRALEHRINLARSLRNDSEFDFMKVVIDRGIQSLHQDIFRRGTRREAATADTQLEMMHKVIRREMKLDEYHKIIRDPGFGAPQEGDLPF